MWEVVGECLVKAVEHRGGRIKFVSKDQPSFWVIGDGIWTGLFLWDEKGISESKVFWKNVLWGV